MSIPIAIICGQSKSGKDTLGNYLVEKFGGVRISLADPLKSAVQSMFGLPDDVWWGGSEDRNKNYEGINKVLQWNHPIVKDIDIKLLLDWLVQFKDGFTPRKVLQTFGTEVVRSFNPDLWVEIAIKTSLSLLNGGYEYDKKDGLIPNPKATAPGLVVISDGRFRNEILKVKAIGGTAIKIYRPNSDSSTPTAGMPNHSSELEISGIPGHFFDVEVKNDGSLDVLKEKGYVIGTEYLHLDKPKHIL